MWILTNSKDLWEYTLHKHSRTIYIPTDTTLLFFLPTCSFIHMKMFPYRSFWRRNKAVSIFLYHHFSLYRWCPLTLYFKVWFICWKQLEINATTDTVSLPCISTYIEKLITMVDWNQNFTTEDMNLTASKLKTFHCYM